MYEPCSEARASQLIKFPRLQWTLLRESVQRKQNCVLNKDTCQKSQGKRVRKHFSRPLYKVLFSLRCFIKERARERRGPGGCFSVERCRYRLQGTGSPTLLYNSGCSRASLSKSTHGWEVILELWGKDFSHTSLVQCQFRYRETHTTCFISY